MSKLIAQKLTKWSGKRIDFVLFDSGHIKEYTKVHYTPLFLVDYRGGVEVYTKEAVSSEINYEIISVIFRT